MDTVAHKCKSCEIVFDDVDQEIDKCVKKRLYCELCLAQKNPRSETEQKIKKRYIQITALSALIILAVLFALNWGQNKNDVLLEYLVGFGFGYLIIWGFTALLLIPVLLLMKKPHKIQIKKEKEKYIKEIEVKKTSRKTLQDQQKKAEKQEGKG